MDPAERDALVRATVASTLRKVSWWGLANASGGGEELRSVADQVDRMDADEPCCPVCEETVCDEDCPLAGIRKLGA